MQGGTEDQAVDCVAIIWKGDFAEVSHMKAVPRVQIDTVGKKMQAVWAPREWVDRRIELQGGTEFQACVAWANQQVRK